MTEPSVDITDDSTRERIARFVRRHRALVITVAAALGVLAIGAWIAVGRVLAARDEAIARALAAEAARQAETERASDLVVSQARLLLATNPTAAVAMVRGLATTSRWREVRAVAAGARASGVPRRLPGPASVGCAALSHAGTRAVACGADGSLHLYDLAARTHVVVATLQGRVRAMFVDEQHLVAWTGATFTVIDTTTRARTTFDHATGIARVDARDGFIWFVDDRKQAWRRSLATGAVVAIPIAGEVTKLAVSPDGKRVAFAGDHVWLIDTKHPELVEKIRDGKAFEVTWSATSEHLAVIGERFMADITVHPEIEVEEYNLTNQTAVVARDVMYSAGLGGFTVGNRQMGDADVQSALAGLHITAGEFVVAAGRTTLRIFDGQHEYRVPLPASPVAALVASPRSPYVLAVCAELILVWNIEHVMPRRLAVPAYAQIVTVGRDRAWTIGKSARSVDLRSGEVRELGPLSPLRGSSPASGAYLAAQPFGTKDTWIVKPDGKPETIDTDSTHATSFDDRRVVLATKQNELVIYDVQQRTKQTVATLGGAIERILVREASPRWIVAVLADGTLSRHDLAGGRATQTQIAPRSELFDPGRATTAPTTTGDVYFGSGERLRRWRADGTVDDVATFPRAVHASYLLDDAWIVVTTDDGTAYSVATQNAAPRRMPALGANFSWASLDPALIVTDDRSGGVTVVDVVANAAWKIAHATPAGSTPAIAGDAIVMRDATLDSTAIAVWPLDLPATAEATRQWIDEITNATYDPRTGVLGWSAP